MAHGGKRSYVAHRFATNVPNKFIEIKVAYSDGGASFTDLGGGRGTGRSFYMHVTPITIEHYNGAEIKTFMMFRGLKAKLEEVKRYSEKKLLELVAQVRNNCKELAPNVMNLVNRVLLEEDLVLQEEVTAL